MQVQCGTQTRLLRSDILDKDMFDAATNTPQHTSWTMQLLERLDRAVGPGVMEKPAFSVPQGEESPLKVSDSETLDDLSSGKFDTLFQGGQFRLSNLYRAALNPPAPSVRLLSSTPTPPEVFVPPEYPSLAKLNHVEGIVSFVAEIDTNGAVTNLSLETEHPLLCSGVKRQRVAGDFHYVPSATRFRERWSLP